MTLPYGIIAADSLLTSGDTKARDMVTDSAVVLEAFLISNVAVITLKHAMRRPRPSQYTDAAPEEYFGSLEHQLSFPSGHAAAVSSAMTATTMTYWLRHPDSPARWVLAGSSLGLTVVTALGRVQAGKHFPSDVFTGAVIGTTTGLAVPWVHRAESELQSTVSWTGQNALVSLSGQF